MSSKQRRAVLTGLIAFGLGIIGLQVNAIAATFGAQDERPPTLQEVKQRVNPDNRSNVIVTPVGDGTFRVEYIWPVPPGSRALPPPVGGYDSPASQGVTGGHK